MRTHLVIQRLILVGSFVVLPWLLSSPAPAAEQASGATILITASAEGLGEMASGAVGDSLKACLARIPKDGSDGQRMLAEQSCQQEEMARKEVQDAPKF